MIRHAEFRWCFLLLATLCFLASVRLAGHMNWRSEADSGMSHRQRAFDVALEHQAFRLPPSR